MAFDDSVEKSVSELLAPVFASFRRYWKVALGPAVAILCTGAFLAWRLPSYYTADARILMQPQRINSKILEDGESKDKDEMKQRLESLSQEILSRPRLRSIIERLQVYPALKGISGGEKALRKFNENIEMAPVQSATGGMALQVFKLGFTHNDPQMAFEVTKSLTNLFIEESIVDLRAEAQGAEEFFDSQLGEARKKLEEMEDKKQEFISANFGKLPEHLEQAMARLQLLNAQMDTNTQLLTANMQRRANVESLLQEARRIGPTSTGGQQIASDPQERLSQLESALVVLKSRYSDQHPDVMKTKNQIAAIREEIAKSGSSAPKQAAAAPSGGGSSTLVFSTRRELGEVDVQIASLREESKRVKEDIDHLQADIQLMPVKEQELLKINRDYANIKGNYERLLGAREQAGLQTSLIRSQKGQQFRIVDPVELPRIPAGPPRLIIAIGSVVLSLLIFAVFPVGLYFVNSSYRMKDELESEFGIPVVGVIPPMVSPESLAFDRRLGMTSFLISASGAAIVSVVIFLVL